MFCAIPQVTGARSLYKYNASTREHKPVDPPGEQPVSEAEAVSTTPYKSKRPTLRSSLNNWFSTRHKKKRSRRPRWARRPRRVACG